MMAIPAGTHNYMEWHDIWPQEEGRTDLFWLYVFFQRVTAQLAINHPDRPFCFTMDNLTMNKHPMVLGLITGQGHCYLFCAPYWSFNGPIEYTFHMSHTKLLSFFGEIEDLDMLGTCLNKIVDDMVG
jgi:hypothetical protein